MLQVIGYAIAVAALLCAVGFCVEQVLARWGLPRRSAWCFAMLASMLFPLLMMLQAQPAPVVEVVVSPPAELVAVPAAAPQLRTEPVAGPAAAVAAPPSLPVSVPAAALPAPKLVTVSPMPPAQAFARWIPPLPSDQSIIALWIAASSLLLLYVFGNNLLLHYRASRWRRESVMGHEVVVSTDTGPALLGALRPKIVVPHWCLEESAQTRTLILQHEQQHIARRDPLLLWAAVLVVVALPWNLPLWWQLRRLRLAIELDCDARVLRAGADAGSYGEVLLAVTRRAAGLPGVAIAMGQPMSALERRIRNLARVSPRHAGLRTAGSLLLIVAGAAAAAMLEAPMMPGAGAGPDIGSQTDEAPAVLSMAVATAGRGAVLPGVGAASEMPNAAPAQPPATAPAAGTKPSATKGSAPAGPLDCIDPDVLRGLLLPGGQQSLNVSTVSPPELADFKVPRELRWVAVSERSTNLTINGSPTTQTSAAAVYRSSLSPEAARTAGAGALTAGGWKLQSDERPSSNNVFPALNYPGGGETYCRAGKPVSVSSGAMDGVTYLILSISRNIDTGSGSGIRFSNPCDQPPRFLPRPVSELDKYLPKLELPRDPATGQPVARSGGGGGGSKFNVNFMVKDSVVNVASHFAKQIAAQGWSADANWNGLGTAGSTWTRNPDANLNLRATLTVSAFDDGWFTVIFNANSAK